MADMIIIEKANITAIADKMRALDNSSASLNFEETDIPIEESEPEQII